jgi:hypothetical protein
VLLQVLVNYLFQSGGDERLLMGEQPMNHSGGEFMMLLDAPLALLANGGF